MSSSSWFSELVMDPDNLFPESEMTSSGFSALDESAAKLVDELETDIQNSVFHEGEPFIDPTKHTDFGSVSSVEAHQTGFDKPAKRLKTCEFNSSNIANQESLAETPISPCVFSEEAEIPPGEPLELYEDLDYTLMWKEFEGVSQEQTPIPPLISTSPGNDENHAPPAAPGAKDSSEKSPRPPSRGREHVIAERNRRQKLNMQFIALSALLPGLRKTDKGSVLGEATKHLKQLQQRVNLLEAQIKQKSKKPVVLVNETHASSDDDDSSSHSKKVHPRIEAEASEKNVLIRIHVEKRKQCLTKILAAIEKLHLNVVSSSVLPFGESAVVITIVGQMDAEFHLSVKDLQTNLLSAILKFM